MPTLDKSRTILLYSLDIYPLNKADIRSLAMVCNVTLLLMKLFRTSNINILKDCCTYFNYKLPKFLANLIWNSFKESEMLCVILNKLHIPFVFCCTDRLTSKKLLYVVRTWSLLCIVL